MAELHGDALRHAPLLREHVPVLLLVVQQLALDPGVPSINLVQPGDLERSVILSFNSVKVGKCGAQKRRFLMITHVLIFLEQHQILRKVLPDELFDDLLFDARVQHVGHQAGVSQHVTRATWSLDGLGKLEATCRAVETTRTQTSAPKEYLGALRGERFFEICQNLCAQLTLSCLYSKQTKTIITLTCLLRNRCDVC